MTFRVVVSTFILEPDDPRYEEDEGMNRVIELPFPPFVGLEIGGDGWEGGEIFNVYWDTAQQRFEVLTDIGHQLVGGRTPDGVKRTPEQAWEQLLKEGWTDSDE